MEVARGTAIARRPLHRSRRAALPHRVSPSMSHRQSGQGCRSFGLGKQRPAMRRYTWRRRDLALQIGLGRPRKPACCGQRVVSPAAEGGAERKRSRLAALSPHPTRAYSYCVEWLPVIRQSPLDLEQAPRATLRYPRRREDRLLPVRQWPSDPGVCRAGRLRPRRVPADH